jgi:hypothetical protein
MHVGDFFRGVARFIDEKFVHYAGRPLVHYRLLPVSVKHDADGLYYPESTEKKWENKPTFLRGFYEIPVSTATGQFGIDAPDEMLVELGFNDTVKALGKVPGIGDLFLDCNHDKWIVVQRSRKDDMVRGQNRLILTVCRFQESVTTGGKQDVEHHQGTV